jgi:uncharacterized membrane protein YraQ (UPF0718 family)
MSGAAERVHHRDWLASGVAGGLLLLLLVGGLITYKSSAALQQIERARVRGAISTRADVVPAGSTPALSVTARSVNYLAVIWQALVFGLLISAAVRAFVPVRALSRLFSGGSIRGQLIAGASGAPLMLCSCCVAPIFSAVFRRTSRLGPSLALMLAAPALNPAALVLTFLLFSPDIAWARLAMSLIAVFAGSLLVARLAGDTVRPVPMLAVDVDPAPKGGLVTRYLSRWYTSAYARCR